MSSRASETLLESSAPVFAALGDITRLEILSRLGQGGIKSITELSAGSPITRQAITKHLQVLDRAGLAHGSKLGRRQVWQLNSARLQDARRCLELIGHEWEQALDRLKVSIEGEVDR